jgi:hypothetical protein
MARPRVLFGNHTSKIAGAELVLLDIVRAWRCASAFLFEDGPLDGALRERGLGINRSRFGGGLPRYGAIGRFGLLLLWQASWRRSPRKWAWPREATMSYTQIHRRPLCSRRSPLRSFAVL